MQPGDPIVQVLIYAIQGILYSCIALYYKGEVRYPSHSNCAPHYGSMDHPLYEKYIPSPRSEHTMLCPIL